MNANGVYRRDVLAAVGTVGTVSLSNDVQAVETGETTRLVEAGIEFSVPEDSYVSMRLDGNPIYYVDEKTDAIVLYPSNSTDRNTIIDNDQVIVGRGAGAKSATIGPENERRIVTRISGVRRPIRSVLLDSTITETAAVSLSGGTVDVRAGDATRSLAVRESIALSLPSRRVTAITRASTEETVSVEGVPDYRECTPMETGATGIVAEPTLLVKNWGDLRVVEIAGE